jgi:pyridoxamine 5'-phosphate oxidase
MNRDIASIRNEYSKEKLDVEKVDKDPIIQFKYWFEEALNSDIYEPTSMHLSTADRSGKPSGRIVLLKGILNDKLQKGFIFFTNYESKKGKEIEENTAVALTFFWPELERQVRIEGIAQKADAEISDNYFKSRPIESQIGASASPQSQKISGRDVLEEKIKLVQQKYEEQGTLNRPENWGGYLVNPHKIEFWQGRPSRLHDRILFELLDGNWEISRLAP